MDSNHRPHAYQACALTSWAISPFRPPVLWLQWTAGRIKRSCFKFYSGSHLLSHTVSSTVPSAVLVLTIVFGMRTGVSPRRITTRNLSLSTFPLPEEFAFWILQRFIDWCSSNQWTCFPAFSGKTLRLIDWFFFNQWTCFPVFWKDAAVDWLMLLNQSTCFPAFQGKTLLSCFLGKTLITEQ